MPIINLKCNRCDFQKTVSSCSESDSETVYHQNSNSGHRVSREIVSGNCFGSNISKFFQKMFSTNRLD